MRQTKPFFLFLTIILTGSALFARVKDNTLVSSDTIPPERLVKLDPSHLMFTFAQGIMLGYEAKLNHRLNWSFEVGTAVKTTGQRGEGRKFKSGLKVKAGIRRYFVHHGKKRNRLFYVAFGGFYDDHRMIEAGRTENTLGGAIGYETRRYSFGLELLNGLLLPISNSIHLEPYGVLRSSIRIRDHLNAPDFYFSGATPFFSGVRQEGSKWRSFHVMVGFKLSYQLR